MFAEKEDGDKPLYVTVRLNNSQHGLLRSRTRLIKEELTLGMPTLFHSNRVEMKEPVLHLPIAKLDQGYDIREQLTHSSYNSEGFTLSLTGPELDTQRKEVSFGIKPNFRLVEFIMDVVANGYNLRMAKQHPVGKMAKKPRKEDVQKMARIFATYSPLEFDFNYSSLMIAYSLEKGGEQGGLTLSKVLDAFTWYSSIQYQYQEAMLGMNVLRAAQREETLREAELIVRDVTSRAKAGERKMGGAGEVQDDQDDQEEGDDGGDDDLHQFASPTNRQNQANYIPPVDGVGQKKKDQPGASPITLSSGRRVEGGLADFVRKGEATRRLSDTVRGRTLQPLTASGGPRRASEFDGLSPEEILYKIMDKYQSAIVSAARDSLLASCTEIESSRGGVNPFSETMSLQLATLVNQHLTKNVTMDQLWKAIEGWKTTGTLEVRPRAPRPRENLANLPGTSLTTTPVTSRLPQGGQPGQQEHRLPMRPFTNTKNPAVSVEDAETEGEEEDASETESFSNKGKSGRGLAKNRGVTTKTKKSVETRAVRHNPPGFAPVFSALQPGQELWAPRWNMSGEDLGYWPATITILANPKVTVCYLDDHTLKTMKMAQVRVYEPPGGTADTEAGGSTPPPPTTGGQRAGKEKEGESGKTEQTPGGQSPRQEEGGGADVTVFFDSFSSPTAAEAAMVKERDQRFWSTVEKRTTPAKRGKRKKQANVSEFFKGQFKIGSQLKVRGADGQHRNSVIRDLKGKVAKVRYEGEGEDGPLHPVLIANLTSDEMGEGDVSVFLSGMMSRVPTGGLTDRSRFVPPANSTAVGNTQDQVAITPKPGGERGPGLAGKGQKDRRTQASSTPASAPQPPPEGATRRETPPHPGKEGPTPADLSSYFNSVLTSTLGKISGMDSTMDTTHLKDPTGLEDILEDMDGSCDDSEATLEDPHNSTSIFVQSQVTQSQVTEDNGGSMADCPEDEVTSALEQAMTHQRPDITKDIVQFNRLREVDNEGSYMNASDTIPETSSMMDVLSSALAEMSVGEAKPSPPLEPPPSGKAPKGSWDKGDRVKVDNQKIGTICALYNTGKVDVQFDQRHGGYTEKIDTSRLSRVNINQAGEGE